jgi:hypothetical protein
MQFNLIYIAGLCAFITAAFHGLSGAYQYFLAMIISQPFYSISVLYSKLAGFPWNFPYTGYLMN